MKVVALITLSLLVVWFWPATPIDMTKVHPELRGLQLPLRKAATGYYLDGGSIGVRLEDASGKILAYAVPCESAAGKYKELRVGAMHAKDGETKSVESPEESMRYLQRLVDDAAPLNVDKVAALFFWRASPRDCLRLAGWGLLSQLHLVGDSDSTRPTQPAAD